MINPHTRLEAWYPTSNMQAVICTCVHGWSPVAYFVYKKDAEDGTEYQADLSEMLADGLISQQEALELKNSASALQGLYRQFQYTI